MKFSKDHWISLLHPGDPGLQCPGLGCEPQSFGRLAQWLVGETEGSVMHGNHQACVKVDERFESLLGVHVNRAKTRRVIGADGQQRDVDWKSFSDLAESVEVSGVSTMINHPSRHFDHEATEAAVRVVEQPGAPVVTRGEGDAHGAVFKTFPVVKLLNDAEPEVMHEITDFERDNNRLVRRDSAQGAPVEVVEVGVSDENQIDAGQSVEFYPWAAHPFDSLNPVAPDGVDENIQSGGLKQKRRVADPRQSEVSAFKLRPFGPQRPAFALCEQGGQEDLCDGISLGPCRRGAQPNH